MQCIFLCTSQIQKLYCSQSCLNLDFGSCEESDQKQNPANTPEDDCALDDDSVDQQQKISECGREFKKGEY